MPIKNEVLYSFTGGEVEIKETTEGDVFCRYQTSIGPTTWKIIELGDSFFGDALIEIISLYKIIKIVKETDLMLENETLKTHEIWMSLAILLPKKNNPQILLTSKGEKLDNRKFLEMEGTNPGGSPEIIRIRCDRELPSIFLKGAIGILSTLLEQLEMREEQEKIEPS